MTAVTAVTAVRTLTLPVTRTARVALLGPATPAIRELWFVLHGYSQLAATFIEDFRPIDDGTRLIIAPEALSRFYDGELSAESHRNGKVGASWMTKESRETEISDYLGYLNAVRAHVSGLLGGATPRVTVLGFSQGGSTASRWVAEGIVPASRLIVWGSSLPMDVDIASPTAPLRRVNLELVIGSRDQFATPPLVEKETARLNAAGYPFTFRGFDGGHRLDADVLREVAGVVTPGDATGT